MKRKKIVGKKSKIPDLIYDPVNEQGVVFLFAKYHKDLGIEYIEGLQEGFPDAFGRRKIEKNKYENVNIEFEFESIAFKNHDHPIEECDVIVCWEHNWKDCPIEVIELKSTILELRQARKIPFPWQDKVFWSKGEFSKEYFTLSNAERYKIEKYYEDKFDVDFSDISWQKAWELLYHYLANSKFKMPNFR